MNLQIINQMKRKLPRLALKKVRLYLRKWLIINVFKNQYLDNFANNKEVDLSSASNLFQFGKDEMIEISSQDYLNDTPSWMKPLITSYKIPKPYLYEIHDAQLVGPLANGFTFNKKLIRETTTPIFFELEQGVNIRSLILEKLPIIKSSELDTACSLVHVWSHNYYHWIIDCLSRLEVIEYYYKQTGIKPKLIIPPNPSQWQTESLQLLGYEPDDFICWNTSKMQVNTLLAPSFRMGSILSVSPSACSWVRQNVIDSLSNIGNVEHSFSPRILISRSKASRRRVINENKLIDMLLPFGFSAYHLEDLNFTDQVKLFSQAEIVIAPHGAGLVNMIFSQNLTLIEFLRQPINPIFFYMAKALGFKYSQLDCTSESLKANTSNDDMFVDLNSLERLIISILGK